MHFPYTLMDAIVVSTIVGNAISTFVVEWGISKPLAITHTHAVLMPCVLVAMVTT